LLLAVAVALLVVAAVVEQVVLELPQVFLLLLEILTQLP